MSNLDVKQPAEQPMSKEEKLGLLGEPGSSRLRERADNKCGITTLAYSERRVTNDKDREEVFEENGEFFVTDIGANRKEIKIKIEPKDVITVRDFNFFFESPGSMQGGPQDLQFQCEYTINTGTGEVIGEIEKMMHFEDENISVGEEDVKVAEISQEAKVAIEAAMDSQNKEAKNNVEPYLDVETLKAFQKSHKTVVQLHTHVPKWVSQDPDIPDLDDPDMPFLLLKKFPERKPC